jgi:hypothetical protein
MFNRVEIDFQVFEKYLVQNGFFVCPASINYHGNYDGGLSDHSLEVTQALVNLTVNNNLKWRSVRSPWVIGMFHDLCKIDTYRRPIIGETIDGTPIHDNTSWEHNPNVLLKGHGDKSVMLLSQFMILTEEEVFCIRYHMGAFTDKEEWKLYTRAVNKYPNVLWTHHADMIASQVKGV